MRKRLGFGLRGAVATIAIACTLVPPPTSVAFAQASRGSQAATVVAGLADWPRVIHDGTNDITVYQPQVERWQDGVLEARAAVSIDKPGTEANTLGVVWFKANTRVDKEADVVALDDVTLVKSSFPSDPANAEAYAADLREHAATGLRRISLARLQASLAVAEAEAGATKSVTLRNDPPRIIYSETPAMLVLIDGKPQLRQLAGTKLLRVINTPALIVFEESSGTYFLRALKAWWSAKTPEGDWTAAPKPPGALSTALKAATSNVNLMDEPPAEIATAVAGGGAPKLTVSLEPAELIQTAGHPEYTPITGTELLYVKNTNSQIIIDVANQDHYVLISGRWFRSKSLAEGPWAYVASDRLPSDFAKIPESHPKGDVLASVSGTAQAQQSLVDNQIPQTATVDRKKATTTVRYDGQPELKPIPGTTLEYVVNASVPVIKLGNAFYAIENGVWFSAASLNGPWHVATEVPPAIYTIPADSPLHYVTYAKVYRSTADAVYVGYTPGYYGTVAAPTGVVVYGTGYYYPAWVGAYWYPAPLTYGYGTAFGWGAATGFTIGAIAGAAWAGGAWGWRGWGPGWHGGGNVIVNNFNFNHANIYNRWTNNSVHTRIDNRVGNRVGERIGNRGQIGRRELSRGPAARSAAATIRHNHPRANDIYAGRNGEVMRRGTQGWQEHRNGNWANAGGRDFRHLDREQFARVHGEGLERFRGGGFAGGGGRFAARGGFHGGGFRGGGFHGGGFHGGGHGGFRR